MVPADHSDAGLPYVCQDAAKHGRRKAAGIRNSDLRFMGYRLLGNQFLQEVRTGAGKQDLPDGGGGQGHPASNR